MPPLRRVANVTDAAAPRTLAESRYRDVSASGLAASTGAATFGEIRDRAQLVVVWRADPAATHPRLLERLRLDRASRSGRALVVVGAAGTPTADEADEVIELGDGLDLEALWATRALARGTEPRR